MWETPSAPRRRGERLAPGRRFTQEDSAKVHKSSGGAPTSSNDDTKKLFESVRISILGTFVVCWCHEAGCGNEDYITRLGSLVVRGPNPGRVVLDFSFRSVGGPCSIGLGNRTPSTLKVKPSTTFGGASLLGDDRVLYSVSSDTPCSPKEKVPRLRF